MLFDAVVLSNMVVLSNTVVVVDVFTTTVVVLGTAVVEVLVLGTALAGVTMRVVAGTVVLGPVVVGANAFPVAEEADVEGRPVGPAAAVAVVDRLAPSAGGRSVSGVAPPCLPGDRDGRPGPWPGPTGATGPRT